MSILDHFFENYAGGTKDGSPVYPACWQAGIEHSEITLCKIDALSSRPYAR